MQSYKQWIPSILNIALEASQAILAIQQSASYEKKLKLDNSPVTEADLRSDQILQQGLRALDPNIPCLSEEGEVSIFEKRKDWDRFWLIDPLDGTRDFIKGGKEFVINIALIENHVPVLSVIAVPHQETAYWAVKNQGAFYQKWTELPKTLQVAKACEKSPLKIIVSRHQDPVKAEETVLHQRLPAATFIRCNSALKFCLLALGEAHLYPRFGTVSEWDIAAGHLLVEEAGGIVVNLNGSAILYNLSKTLDKVGFYAAADPQLARACCG